MAIKRKEAINDVLKMLGYFDFSDGTWAKPAITIRETIFALCNYLDVDITKHTEAIARKRSKK